MTQHIVDAQVVPEDEFLPRVAVTLKEQRGERRATMEARCAKVEELVRGKSSALVWCHMNDEGDELAATIPGAVQVAGSDSDDVKEERLMAFSRGEIRVLVTKPTIAGFGMNWQHCGTMTFFPSHSYEQYYQGVRRCWRFGRSGPVDVHVVTTPGEAGVTGNLQKKSDQAEAMFARLVEEMNNQIRLERVRSTFDQKESLPSWL